VAVPVKEMRELAGHFKRQQHLRHRHDQRSEYRRISQEQDANHPPLSPNKLAPFPS
jgi:hypothetical protein